MKHQLQQNKKLDNGIHIVIVIEFKKIYVLVFIQLLLPENQFLLLKMPMKSCFSI